MRRLLPLAAIVLLAVPAAAEGGEGHLARDIGWPGLNLLILLGVLVYFARAPMKAFFAERRCGIQGELETAQKLHSDAQERFATWQRKLNELESEIAGIRATARERAESERATILADAAASAERIQRDASAAIEQELRRCREALREEAADLAVELAAGRLGQVVSDADRERLVDEFIQHVEQAPARAGNGG